MALGLDTSSSNLATVEDHSELQARLLSIEFDTLNETTNSFMKMKVRETRREYYATVDNMSLQEQILK